MSGTRRIAMWSGPRNLSTAMMRSFAARGDCACVDEPFYAHYLRQTGLPHPMREAVIESQPADWRKVVPSLTTGPVDQPIQYQKHMVQHMLPCMDLDWTERVTNVFLIREPERVAASFAAKRGLPDPEELGFARQWQMYRAMAARGPAPVVIDSADIRRDPARALRALCKASASRGPRACCPGRGAQGPRTGSGARSGMTPSTPRPDLRAPRGRCRNWMAIWRGWHASCAPITRRSRRTDCASNE